MRYEETILFGMKNKKILSRILGIEGIFNSKKSDTSFIYEEKYLDKKTKEFVAESVKDKTRTIIAAKSDRISEANKHKKALKKLNKIFQQSFPEENLRFITSTLKETTNIDNAMRHVKGKFALTIDLKDYFTSISRKQIKDMLIERYGMAIDAAAFLAGVVTFSHKKMGGDGVLELPVLPQGFPTSPILSSLVNLPAFEELNAFANDRDIKFTVYVDDMTFSSNNSISKQEVEAIFEILKRHNIKVNYKKYKKPRKISIHKGVLITGINVKADKVFPYMKATKWNAKNYMSRMDMIISIVSKTSYTGSQADFFMIWKKFGDNDKGGFLPEFCGIYNYLNEFDKQAKGKVSKNQEFRAWRKYKDYYKSFYDVYIKSASLFGRARSYYNKMDILEKEQLRKAVNFSKNKKNR